MTVPLSVFGLLNLALRVFSGDFCGLPPGFLGLPVLRGLPNSFSSIVCGVFPPVLLSDVFAELDWHTENDIEIY